MATLTRVASQARPLFNLTYRRRLGLIGFLFVLPALLYFAVFAFYPIFSAFYHSMFEYDLLSSAEKTWVGFRQYESLLRSQPFLNS